MYPSPPLNTPEGVTPAPSIVHRSYPPRSRGFSIIGARLAHLDIDSCEYTHCDSDDASNRSAEPSVTEHEECDVARISEMLSDSGRCKLAPRYGSMSLPAPLISPTSEDSVPIALGSPTVNPRIDEYLSFTSKDLPTKAVAACVPSAFVGTASSLGKTAIVNESLKSHNSIKSDGGVTEKSNWAEELEESLDRTCMRLEQLARDEFVADPSVSVEEYYITRLKRLLGSGKREVPVNIQKMAKASEGAVKMGRSYA